MPRYLIELTHGDEHEVCVKALHAIERYGSHLVTSAHWGCRAGSHSGWLIADVDNRDEAVQLVPPEFRADARIVEVEHFTILPSSSGSWRSDVRRGSGSCVAERRSRRHSVVNPRTSQRAH